MYLTNKTFSYYAKNLYFLKSCSFGSLEETAFEHVFVETDSSLPDGPFDILVDKKKNEVWILVIIILLVIAVLASVIAVSIVCAIKQKKRKRVITLGDYGNRENLLEVPKHERNLLFELHAN